MSKLIDGNQAELLCEFSNKCSFPIIITPRSTGCHVLEMHASPEPINQSSYEAGWLAVIEPSAWDAERSKLLGPAAYFAVMQAQVQEDLKGLSNTIRGRIMFFTGNSSNVIP